MISCSDLSSNFSMTSGFSSISSEQTSDSDNSDSTVSSIPSSTILITSTNDSDSTVTPVSSSSLDESGCFSFSVLDFELDEMDEEYH